MKTKPRPGPFALLENDALPYCDDDELLPRTPDDVVALLGFDPLELEPQKPTKQRKAKR
jgi:hypothetical protein